MIFGIKLRSDLDPWSVLQNQISWIGESCNGREWEPISNWKENIRVNSKICIHNYLQTAKKFLDTGFWLMDTARSETEITFQRGCWSEWSGDPVSAGIKSGLWLLIGLNSWKIRIRHCVLCSNLSLLKQTHRGLLIHSFGSGWKNWYRLAMEKN